MNIPQKLHAIQKLSGHTQTELAQKLGVSFVALNRWSKERALPRKKAQERIDALYRQYSGLAVIPEGELQAKKAMLMAKAKKSKSVLSTILHYPDIRDQFVLVLTYTSNSIEGSTLTEAETASVLFENVALPDKTLIEQLEAKNHQTALLYLFHHLSAKNAVDEELILKLHGMLMNSIRHDAGCYRQHGVRIVGADLPTANYLKVPTLMQSLVTELSQGKDFLEHLASIHARFEQIHPFSDGNGRIGRLLMYAMLLQQNLPPVVIQPNNKKLYYSYLNTAQKKGDTTLLQDFLCDGIMDGWDIVERTTM